MAVSANPFTLFPRQIEHAELWAYRSPGLGNSKLADLTIILKRSTSSDAPAADYMSRIEQRRAHIQTSTLPTLLAINPDSLISHILRTDDGSTFIITDASRGDDMDTGATEFVTVRLQPYGRDSL